MSRSRAGAESLRQDASRISAQRTKLEADAQNLPQDGILVSALGQVVAACADVPAAVKSYEESVAVEPGRMRSREFNLLSERLAKERKYAFNVVSACGAALAAGQETVEVSQRRRDAVRESEQFAQEQTARGGETREGVDL
ncbi:MAG: hypothetical protein AB2A00_25490 [Myxococcota bacterium]